jgi:hypothetical protein
MLSTSSRKTCVYSVGGDKVKAGLQVILMEICSDVTPLLYCYTAVDIRDLVCIQEMMMLKTLIVLYLHNAGIKACES